MKTSVHLKTIINKYLVALATGMLLAFTGAAQTYTTQADGNWTSPGTWVGGQVPGRNIAAGVVVNINHDVNFNVNGDLIINGTLKIVGDTLRFGASWTRDVTVNATGLLYIKNGGYLQDLPSAGNSMTVTGRIYFENAKVAISKDYMASSGASRTYKSSTIKVGEDYSMQGTSTNPIIDTIQNSTVETGITNGGIFELKAYATVRVFSAKIIANGSNLKVSSTSSFQVASAGNIFGFSILKVENDLDVDGNWDARIDAHCIGGQITGNNMAAIDFTRTQDCSAGVEAGTGTAPELQFKNPVLKRGQANKQGAVYRFSNVTPGIDAEVELKKFSSSKIVMQSIDLASMGWDKAFQPQFGIPGLVQPWQNWYIDFEMTFYEAGTNRKQRVAKMDLTALDVDGDGNSITEYAVFETPSNIIYSTVSYLTNQSAGLLGQTFTCPLDALSSALVSCTACGGDGKGGIWNIAPCTACDAGGLIYDDCDHPYDGVNGSSLLGPVENFFNIDTLATQVMATYQYVDKDRIRFRYGAKSGAKSSNGSGVRLNSLWFRQFSMTPQVVLPVKLTNFAATYDKKNVKLSWTGHEENFSHYVLQRSVDGKEFADVTTVFATNNANAETNYAFKDMNVSSSTGMLFYRLQMVDNTKEAAKLSEVKAIRLSREQDGLKLATYPNPVVDQLRVTLPSAWQGKPVMIELYNINGVRIQNIQLGAASQTETLEIGKHSKGVYLVKASCENEVAQERIIKNR